MHVREACYSVPARYVGRRLDVRVGAETIEALDGAQVVARHGRSLKGEENLVLDHYLEVLAIKPGALPGATALGPGGRRRVSPPPTNAFGTTPGATAATGTGPRP